MKVIGKIFAVVFSTIYFFILLALLIINFGTNILKGDFYVSILKSVDLKTIKVSDLGNIIGTDEIDEGTTLEEVLIESLEESGIDKQVGIEILENDEIKEVVGKFIGEYINYSVTKENVPEISKEDINKIINNASVKKVIGNELDGMSIDEIYDELNSEIKDMLKEEE